MNSIEAASLLNATGYYLNMRARYEIARPLFERALNRHLILKKERGKSYGDSSCSASDPTDRGPLGLYGKTCATALHLWAKQVAHLPTNFTSVELEVQDCAENLHDALQTALDKQSDVFFGPYGSGPMLKVARAYTRLIWNHGGASSRLARPAFPQVINVLSPASTYFANILQAIHSADPTARTVSLFHSTTGFGQDVAAGAKAAASRLHMTLQTVPFEPSQAQKMTATVPDADILLVAGNFADETAVAPTFLSRDFRFRAFVGAGVEEVLTSLGERREGLLGPAQWVAQAALQPDEGPDAQWFVKHYREIEGSDPPYAAAQAFASGVVYARCLRETGDPQEEAIQAMAQQLVCRTLFGAFQLDSQSSLQTGHQVVIVQWQQGQRRVVWPPEQAEQSLVFARPA
ncbi:MAG TPA: ABC transporter substrate-binding protein [Ktedonobacteraceae bacterium]|jgi:ABC-type branched-subunit amino acid transport system substrate-binding protein